MRLQEDINRIKQMMGLLNEEEQNDLIPYGIIEFPSKDKILVGDMHQTPLNLPKEWVEKIVNVANSEGYYGEGIGLKHNAAVTESNFYNLLNSKMDKGSWDTKLIESGEVPKDKEYVFLYALFSNIKENHRLEKLLDNVDEGDTIFDILLKTIPDWSADVGKFNLGERELKKFLEEISEGNHNFIEMSEQEATEENLSHFLNVGEHLQWPETKENPNLWRQYPHKAGKFARTATTIRDQFLINATRGVYFVGAGHLKDIVEMPEGKKLGLKVVGGSKI